MHNKVASLLCLPPELLLSILGCVSALEWKQVRQTCKGLNTLAASLLFERVYFELCGSGCDSLHSISQDPLLSCLVKRIVLRRIRGYRKFPDFDVWAESTHQPGAPDVDFNTAPETTYYGNEALREQLMSYAEWVRMPREQKKTLYQAYNADREQQRKEARDITNYLAFPSGAENAAARQFFEALGTLPNLQTFKHEPGFLHDAEWAFRWRDLYFHPFSIIGSTNNEEDEDVEALQLSVVLQVLACVRREGRRLQKMSIYAGGPAFFTPERLQHLWEGDGHELLRTCRLLHRFSSKEADAEAFDSLATSGETMLYREQLKLMAHAFVDLKQLDFMVSDDDELVGCVETAAQLAFLFLTMTRGLERLRLAIGGLADGELLPTHGHNEGQRAMGSILLLHNLALRSPWARIRTIELEIATDKEALMEFLLACKDSLRSLILIRTSLVRVENPLNTWEPTLTEIGHCLSLESLTLSTLCDTPEASGDERVLFDPYGHIWRDKRKEFEAYHSAIVARILRGEVIDSLQDMALDDGKSQASSSALAMVQH
ncbi:hypothetical protein EJ07DRAFT_144203 [Lizonia empirigonia]|nr:hypothetical protein EJ07DRAFT_144203 [Lizonia empirigonia]